MNLAFITNEYPHPYIGKSGGIGTSIKNLAAAYVNTGNRVSVFVLHKAFQRFDDDGIDVIPINSKVRLGGLPGLILNNIAISKKINAYIKEYEIKFIEVPDWCGLAALLNFKCPVVIKLNGSDAYFCELEGRKQKLKNYVLEFLNIHRGNVYISVSKFTADLSKRIFHTGNKQFYILPNALYLDNFPVPVSPKTNDIPVVLYFGSIVRKKGCLEIPYIFNELQKIMPNTKLLLVGNDGKDITTGNLSTWEMMKPQFSNLESVKYLGAKPYQEIRQIIEQADVCIFPSYAEAMPMSWLEAMALKKPTVTSNIGWATEIAVNGLQAFQVYPQNHRNYAERIAELIVNPEFGKKMGDEARKVVEDKFNIHIVAQKHLEIFQTLLSK